MAFPTKCLHMLVLLSLTWAHSVDAVEVRYDPEESRKVLECPYETWHPPYPINDIASSPYDYQYVHHIHEKPVEESQENEESIPQTPFSADVAMKLDSAQNQGDYEWLLQNLTGIEIVGTQTSRMSALEPEHPKCKPVMTLVPFESPSEIGASYVPACTRVNRCEGCCTHNMVSCQPTKSHKVLKYVRKISKVGTCPLKMEIKKLVVEEHAQCECKCIINKEDCNENQRHSECQCKCKNRTEERECRFKRHGVWDKSSCQCKCNNPCSTGMRLNPQSCRCEWIH